MLKIWSMKQQQQKDEAAKGPAGKKKKVTAAQLRVQKGMHAPFNLTQSRGPQKPLTLARRQISASSP